jgi:actin related protein 2/3 complex subunit 4
MDGFDYSFLITEDHLSKYKKEELINFVLSFIQGIEKEIMDLKLNINSQCGTAAKYFATMLANNADPCDDKAGAAKR